MDENSTTMQSHPQTGQKPYKSRFRFQDFVKSPKLKNNIIPMKAMCIIKIVKLAQ
jgi:hypothetical protein